MRDADGARRELCGSCVWAASCAVRARTDGPVICCDRYRRPDAAAGGPAPGSDPVPIGKRQAAGLCASCAARDACKRRYVEGGVFRCADYR